MGVYDYVCCPRITEENKQIIQLGCHIRSREAWEADFWNNPKEFPNDGSKASQRRMLAFKLACAWLDGEMEIGK